VGFLLAALRLPSVALVPLASGCGGEPPRRPNIMHPVDERRAFELIGRVFKEGNLTIERGREETVNGKPMTVDQAAAGHKFGVAYLTRSPSATRTRTRWWWSTPIRAIASCSSTSATT
jgi:hypothetical protein